jgi:hypothetical protein
MNAKIALTVEKLRAILEVVDDARHRNSSVSNTVVIELVKENENQTGSDTVKVYARSSYAECNDHFLGY